MEECPFCNPDIIKKQKLFETETEYVLYNIRKTNKGRCLVVPKRHVGNLRELSEKEQASLIKTVSIVSGKLEEYLHPDGINYGFNEGSISGPVVPHFHFHILPRFQNDPIMKYHLFHGDPKLRSDLDKENLQLLVDEFKKIFDRK
jgi:histidine triad (HIT) family protein